MAEIRRQFRQRLQTKRRSSFEDVESRDPGAETMNEPNSRISISMVRGPFATIRFRPKLRSIFCTRASSWREERGLGLDDLVQKPGLVEHLAGLGFIKDE